MIDLKTEQIDLNRQQSEKNAEAKQKALEKDKEIKEEQKKLEEELATATASFGDAAKKRREAEFAEQKAANEAKLAANKAFLDELDKQNQESADKQKQLDKEIAEAKKQIAYDSLDLISNITELFGRKNEKNAKRAFQIDKAAKISSATMSGVEGTINAFKTASDSAITKFFPAYPFIQAGLAAAFAATNIAKIAQTQFSSSSGSGSQASVPAPSQGVPSVPTPEVNANTTLTAGLPGAGSQAGNKVYVLDSEITAQQTMSQKVTSLATFGG